MSSGIIDPFPTGIKSKVFGVCFAEPLNEIQIGKTVAVGDLECFQPQHQSEAFTDIVWELFGHDCRRAPLEYAALEPVGSVGNICLREDEIFFYRHNCSKLPGKEKTHIGKAFKKSVCAVERTRFRLQGTSSLQRRAAGIVSADDDDIFSVGFDTESVTVQFGNIDPGGSGACRTTDDDGTF